MDLVDYDIVVGGGGYVGLATAVSIKASAPHLRILVVDAAPKDVWKKDGRASAIAAAARHMLEYLQCWENIAPSAQPISDMIVTDSRRSDPYRPVFLTFDTAVEDGQPFAHMVPNVEMIGALRAKARKLAITIRQATAIQDFTLEPSGVKIEFAKGKPVRSRLLIGADGVRSKIRKLAGIKTVEWRYGQSGIVTTVKHERPHNGRAVEHFLPAGPFAILPLTGNRSSLVWTERTEDADRLVSAPDLVFESELEQRFGHELGDISVEGGRRAFPLGLTLARDFIAPGVALVGDAAHGIHPIAGQGLNLGFKDAAALAETIVDADRLGLDIGSVACLERYQTWRRFDTFQMGATTDILNRLFSNDIAPLRTARDFGLGLVDRLPALKSFFIRQAAGIAGQEAPKLLRGEPI